MHGIIVPDRATRSRKVQDLTLGWIKLHIQFFSTTLEGHSNRSEGSLSHLDSALSNKLQCRLRINEPVIEHFLAGP